MTFFDLPIEIRLEIYRYITTSDTPISTRLEPYPRKAPQHLIVDCLPAMASVCRKTRQELLPIYFAENHFHVKSAQNIGPHSVLSLQQMKILAGNYAVHIRHMTLINCNIPYSLNTVLDDADIEARLLNDGRMSVTPHWSQSARQGWPPHCTCPSKQASHGSAYRNQGCRRIVEFFGRCESRYKTCLDTELCASCGLRKIFPYGRQVTKAWREAMVRSQQPWKCFGVVRQPT